MKLLFADERGQVYEHPDLLAAVRGGLPVEAPLPLPAHATLAALPGRRPIGFDPARGEMVEVSEVRVGRRTVRPSAVAAVLPPGWTRTELPAFRNPFHVVAIPNMGLTLGEIFFLEELATDCAADGRYAFLLVAPPLPVKRAVGTPINPYALK